MNLFQIAYNCENTDANGADSEAEGFPTSRTISCRGGADSKQVIFYFTFVSYLPLYSGQERIFDEFLTDRDGLKEEKDLPSAALFI